MFFPCLCALQGEQRLWRGNVVCCSFSGCLLLLDNAARAYPTFPSSPFCCCTPPPPLQLGDGGASGSTSPVAVVGGHVFATIVASYYFTCAIDTAGVAWCFGDNSSAQVQHWACREVCNRARGWAIRPQLPLLRRLHAAWRQWRFRRQLIHTSRSRRGAQLFTAGARELN